MNILFGFLTSIGAIVTCMFSGILTEYLMSKNAPPEYVVRRMIVTLVLTGIGTAICGFVWLFLLE